MTKQEFDNLLRPLTDIIGDIETDLLVDVLKRVNTYNDVKGTLKWYTDKLAEMGLFDKETQKKFSKNKTKLKKVLENIAKECGTKVDNYDKLKEYYDSGKLNTDPSSLFDSVAITNLVNNAVKDTDDIMKLIETKAIEGTKSTYMNTLNKAYVEVASGTYTYTEAIKRAIDDMVSHGIDTANYSNGYHISIESAVRRDVVTRMNKLVGDVELEHAKEMDTNLVYVDQHLGARTRTKYMKHDYEAHDEWQGKVYMVNGSSDKYDNFVEKTGYGEMLGLKGINCYHNFRPFFEWEEVPKPIDIEESRKVEKLLKKQRSFEQRIRKTKRKIDLYKELDDEKVNSLNDFYKELREDYQKFLKENNLSRDYNREYVVRK